jgi:hypothetical protein
MATGRGIQLTKQIGEYLVAAELCRRDFLATTFTGNVQHYDIVASNAKGKTVLVQVKTIKSGSWQFNIQSFAKVVLNKKKQEFKKLLTPPIHNLICVFVELSEKGDKFYVLSWKDLQSLNAKLYKEYLSKYGGKRPERYDSFHCSLKPVQIQQYQDNWKLFNKLLK